MTTKTLTIFGQAFEISAPYAEGHVCTAAEAKTLNQTRTENISNNVRKKVAELRSADESFTPEALQKAAALIAKADAEYVFTLTNAGAGRKVVDPVEKEARAIAKAGLTAKLKERGMTPKTYDEANGEGAFEAKVEQAAAREDVIKAAKKRIAERKNALAGMDI